MEGPSRAQIAAFAALGVVLLLLGVRAVRAEGEGEGAADRGVRIAAEPVGSGGGEGDGDLVVHVAGEVRRPGVYRMPAGARVADAVERAGGPTGDGTTEAINLAARLADGQQIVVPSVEAGVPGAAAGSGASGSGGPISLGTATQADLETISGIGPVTAEKIIAFRDGNGGIGSIDDLDAVPGIGPATLDNLREHLQP